MLPLDNRLVKFIATEQVNKISDDSNNSFCLPDENISDLDDQSFNNDNFNLDDFNEIF